MSEARIKADGGIGFFGLLAIVFIILKLCGTITWSWWWVLGPLWIPAAVVATIFLMIALVVCVVSGIAAFFK